MYSLPKFLLLALLLPACGSAGPRLLGASSTPESEEGAFVVMHGRDTVAVEHFRRSPGRFEAELVLNRVLSTHFSAAVSTDQRVQRLEMTTRRLDRPGPVHETIHLGADTIGAATAARAGDLPYLDRSYVLLEQIIRRAHAIDGSDPRRDGPVSVALHRVIGGTDALAVVALHSADSVSVDLDGRRFEGAIEGDRLLRVHLPAFGISATRVAGPLPGVYPLENIDRPPPGAPYEDEEVWIDAGAGVVLAGTLTVPVAFGSAPRCCWPAIVLITGSGEVNRHGGSPPSVPFRQMADALARRGVAVLRLDDRGVAGSTGDRTTSTMFTEAEDIAAAIDFLRIRPEIDPQRIGLVGHSEGGIIAPMLAVRDPGVALVVTIGGLGGSGREMAEFQVRNVVERVPSIPLEAHDSVVAAEVERQFTALTPRVRSIVTYDDALVVASQVRVPMLVLHGGTDVQVPPSHAPRLAAAARMGGSAEVTMRVFDGLNHNLHPDPDGAASGWPFLPSFTIPQEVLDTIAEWTAGILLADRAG